jgi:hypothetical protein
MSRRTSRKWTAGLAASGAIAIAAVAASSVLGAGGTPPSYGKVSIELHKPAGAADKTRVPPKPRVVYLKSGETNVDPVAIGTPYLDIKLTGCSKVVDGGVLPQNTNVYVQGTFVQSPGEYHVLIGFDDEAVAGGGVVPFTITSHLTCLKGAR